MTAQVSELLVGLAVNAASVPTPAWLLGVKRSAYAVELTLLFAVSGLMVYVIEQRRAYIARLRLMPNWRASALLSRPAPGRA